MKSCLMITSEITKITKQLKDSGIFKVDKTPTTVIATGPNGSEVFRAIKKSSRGPWLARYHEKLFETN